MPQLYCDLDNPFCQPFLPILTKLYSLFLPNWMWGKIISVKSLKCVCVYIHISYSLNALWLLTFHIFKLLLVPKSNSIKPRVLRMSWEIFANLGTLKEHFMNFDSTIKYKTVFLNVKVTRLARYLFFDWRACRIFFGGFAIPPPPINNQMVRPLVFCGSVTYIFTCKTTNLVSDIGC